MFNLYGAGIRHHAVRRPGINHSGLWHMQSEWRNMSDNRHQFRNAPFGAFFCLGFFALLIFALGATPMRSGWLLFYSGHAIPTHFRPMPQNTKNCDAKCDARA